MPDGGRGRGLRVAAVFALFLALYLFTFPLASDGIVLGSDVTWYARNLARGDYWHPHHLLFHLAAAAVLRVRTWVEPGEGPVYAALGAQRLLSALGGAGIVALVYAFCARRLGPLRGALFAGLLGLSTGTWFYAAVGETQTPANVWTTALLVLVALERLEGRARAFWIHGVLLLLAVLVRQDGVLVVPAYLVLAGPRKGGVVVAVVGLCALGLYALAWRLAAPPLGFGEWLHRLAQDGTWNDASGLAGALWSVKVGLFGTASALVYAPSLTATSTAAAVALVALACAAALGRRRPGQEPAHGRVLVGLASFGATRFAFFAWWQPTNPEFHAATWIPLVLLLALLLDRERRAGLQVACLALALLATGVGTARATILPNRDDAAARRARQAIAEAGAGGCVLALDWVQDWALMREAPTDVVVARALPDMLDQARAEIAAAQARGARALLIRDDVLVLRALGISPPPAPGLVAGLARGGELRTLAVDAAGAPWLVEVVGR